MARAFASHAVALVLLLVGFHGVSLLVALADDKDTCEAKGGKLIHTMCLCRPGQACSGASCTEVSIGDFVVHAFPVDSACSCLESAAPAAAALEPKPEEGCMRFYDLGANIGDTILKVAYPESNPSAHVSPHILRQGLNKLKCQHIYSFEGNPRLYPRLFETATRVASNTSHAVRVTAFSTLACTSPTPVTFHVDTTPLGERHHEWASSMLDTKIAQAGTSVQADCSDLAAILKATARPQDTVVIKMDIEGAEFLLLPHLLYDPVTCELIDQLLLEWHSGNAAHGADSQFLAIAQQHGHSSIGAFQQALIAQAKNVCKILVVMGTD